MRLFSAVVVLATLGSSAAAHAEPPGGGNLDHHKVSVDIKVTAPGSTRSGTDDRADAARPLVAYLVSWSVDPTPAQIGSLDGLCAAPGGTPTAPRFGYLYHLVGTDASGKVVDDRYECIAFADTDATGRPPLPPVPAVPTLGEAWNSAGLPAPAVTLDPATRGITGLATHISTDGPETVAIAATIRGYTITGTATLDHYEISVDGQTPTDARRGDFTFDTKGDHAIAISAIWHGASRITGPDLPSGTPPVDIGNAAITATRTYPVAEVRSVLQP
jgi:hypothetical protein